MVNLQNRFKYIKINLVDSEKIKKWGARFLQNGIEIGEINKENFFKDLNLTPTFQGLYCEATFGPIKSWECQCGKYSIIKPKKKIICDICSVEITDNKVRRYRFGYIKLSSPIIHSWYLYSIPNYLALILELSPKLLKNLAYYQKVNLPIKSKGVEGTALLEKLLTNIDLNKEIIKSRLDLNIIELKLNNTLNKINKKILINKQKNLFQRIRLLENFLNTNSQLSWFILNNLPVLPAGLRPILEINVGKMLVSDLSQFYRQIIKANNSIDFVKNLSYFSRTVANSERASLQKYVDALFLNNRKSNFKNSKKTVQLLGETIQGKFGRFRQNLLGKRVDYSARSVIVVNPNLNLNSCGLPYLIATKIFLPYILQHIFKYRKIKYIKDSSKFIEDNNFLIWKIIKLILRKKVILLNRAPTLHRMGIQAFFPKLIKNKAIELHPLVCTAFNADFDGDQMAIHLPLSIQGQIEAKKLMLPSFNILSVATGEAIISAAQDMILGCYYLTIYNPKFDRNYKFFNDFYSILMEYNRKKIFLHSTIYVNAKILNKFGDNKYLKTTVGRILFYFSLFNIFS